MKHFGANFRENFGENFGTFVQQKCGVNFRNSVVPLHGAILQNSANILLCNNGSLRILALSSNFPSVPGKVSLSRCLTVDSRVSTEFLGQCQLHTEIRPGYYSGCNSFAYNWKLPGYSCASLLTVVFGVFTVFYLHCGLFGSQLKLCCLQLGLFYLQWESASDEHLHRL